MNNRTKYSKEFKLDAINLVIEQGYSQTDAGTALSINPKMFSRWIKEHQADDGHAFRGNGKFNPEQEEIRRLRDENKRLKREKEILKKATVDSTGHCNTSFINQHKLHSYLEYRSPRQFEDEMLELKKVA